MGLEPWFQIEKLRSCLNFKPLRIILIVMEIKKKSIDCLKRAVLKRSSYLIF